MGGINLGAMLVVIVFSVGALVFIVMMIFYNSPKNKQKLQRAREQKLQLAREQNNRKSSDTLSGLPVLYYVLAIICGVVLLVFTLDQSRSLSNAEIGAWIGYTVGAVLSMFAVGRVIELLQKSHAALNTLIEIEKFKLQRSDPQSPVVPTSIPPASNSPPVE